MGGRRQGKWQRTGLLRTPPGAAVSSRAWQTGQARSKDEQAGRPVNAGVPVVSFLSLGQAVLVPVQTSGGSQMGLPLRWHSWAAGLCAVEVGERALAGNALPTQQVRLGGGIGGDASRAVDTIVDRVCGGRTGNKGQGKEGRHEMWSAGGLATAQGGAPSATAGSRWAA